MKIQPIRGTHDLYGEKLIKFRQIQKIINLFAQTYDFEEIITPIFEASELFKKPLGEHSDVVLKEMYTFNDRNDSLLTLRPELTTPIIRSAISENLLEKLPQKIYAFGPCFRRERPQKGRYRQFNQINFEILGSHDVIADVELILLADNILKNLFPNHKMSLHINSLGDKDTLKKFKKDLSEYYEKNQKKLNKDSQIKIIKNPLRILDSKNPEDIEVNYNAPNISNYYSKEANDKFLRIKDLLTKNSVKFEINPNLVRGLDYYCHTVFEFKTIELGSQNTLIGGGRYDGLTKLLGGPDIPGVGWAGGVERLIMLMQSLPKKEGKVHFIIINESFKDYGLKIINKLRQNHIKVYFDFKYNLKKSLSKASQANSEFAVIIGENEFKNKLCTLKNLNLNTQETITIEKLIKKLI